MTKRRTDFDRGIIYGIGLACSIAVAENASTTTIARVLNAAGLDRDKLRRIGLDPYDMKKLDDVFVTQQQSDPFELHSTFVKHFPHAVSAPGHQRRNIVPVKLKPYGEIHVWLVEQFGRGTYRSSRFHTRVRPDCTLRWAYSDWADSYYFRNEQDAALFKLFWVNGS